MSELDLAKIKKQLLKQKKQVENDLASFAKKKKSVDDDFDTLFPNYGDDLDSNAAEVDSFAAFLSLEKNLEKNLADINQALQNLEEGTYGKCQVCGGPIQPARLQAFPAATHCMKCDN